MIEEHTKGHDKVEIFRIMRDYKDEARVPGGPGVGLRGYDAAFVSDMTGVDTGRESLVQQHFQDEVDINTIVRRFGVSGQLPLGPNGPAVYGDFSGITDYDSALDTISRANDAFMALPADVRLRFKNDPAELIRYAQSVTEEEFTAALQPPVVEEPPPVVQE